MTWDVRLNKVFDYLEDHLDNGEVYLTFCSKESTEFADKNFPMLDKNTLISQDELEKGIPHFYADLDDLNELLVNFEVELIKHTEYY